MANFTSAAGTVAWVSGVNPELVTANDTLSAGMFYYKDSADNNYAKRCDNDAAGKDNWAGVCLTNTVSALQGFAGAPPGAVINPGCNMTPTTIAVLSRDPGFIMPSEDLTTGEKLSIAGVALATTSLYLLKYQSTIAKP